MSAAPLLELRGVAWHVGGRRIVGPLDLAVHPGETVVLIGPNGAGKTTLLRLALGLRRPSAGDVRFRGAPLAVLGRREIARRIAYLPQVRPARVPLTVEETVLLGRGAYLSPFRLAPAAADFAARDRALATVGIEALRARRVDELSGGERQAAALAGALAQEAELLALDEPTTHLDPKHQRDIVAILGRLRRDAGPALVVATHDLHVAAALGGRVVALRDGRVAADGPAREVLEPARLAAVFDAPFDLAPAGSGPPVPLVRLP